MQAPRSQGQSPRSTGSTMTAGSKKAASLVREAEAACKAGDMAKAKAKADEAIATMK